MNLIRKFLAVSMVCIFSSTVCGEEPGLEEVFGQLLKNEKAANSAITEVEKKPATSGPAYLTEDLDNLFGGGVKRTTPKSKKPESLAKPAVDNERFVLEDMDVVPRSVAGGQSDKEVDAVDNLMLQQMFIQLDQAAGIEERENLLTNEREETLLGSLLSSLDEGKETENENVLSNLIPDEDLGADGLNSLGLLISTLALVPTDEETIFEPTPASYSFRDSVEERRGHYGVSGLLQSSGSYGNSLLVGALARHVLTNRLYGTIEGQFSLTQLDNPRIDTVSANASFSTIAGGVEYALARGFFGIDKTDYLPWEFTTKFLIGQQITSNSQGLYLGLGSSLLFHYDSYWFSADVRYVSVDDEVLNTYEAFSGIQVGASVGLYY